MNLFEQAEHCFLCADPLEKMQLTADTAAQFKAGQLSWDESPIFTDYTDPGRLSRPAIIEPQKLKKYAFKKQIGKAASIHALAHIELTAVNLAWDSVYRYRGLPQQFYQDWVQCAYEESTHFLLLRESLQALGFEYGDFSVHGELWNMASTTRASILERMGVVHRVFEARALDVIPFAQQRFDAVGDKKMVETLNVIANEEIGHISSSSRWFQYQCDLEKIDSEQTFYQLLAKYLNAPPRGPFNRQARLESGFSVAEIEHLEQLDAEFKAKKQAAI